jgi:phosphodiesterase/alkaline phosphatase D-like protein
MWTTRSAGSWPRWNGRTVSERPDQYDPQRTILGDGQERRLHDGLSSSTARWSVVVAADPDGAA